MGTVLRGDCDCGQGRRQAARMGLVRYGLVWNGLAVVILTSCLGTGYSILCCDWARWRGAVGQRERTQECCSTAEAQVDGKGRCSQSKVHVDDAWGDDEKM